MLVEIFAVIVFEEPTYGWDCVMQDDRKAGAEMVSARLHSVEGFSTPT
jgi:hypothetical protein